MREASAVSFDEAGSFVAELLVLGVVLVLLGVGVGLLVREGAGVEVAGFGVGAVGVLGAGAGVGVGAGVEQFGGEPTCPAGQVGFTIEKLAGWRVVGPSLTEVLVVKLRAAVPTAKARNVTENIFWLLTALLGHVKRE